MTTRFAALAPALVLASCLAAPLPGLAAEGPPIMVVDDGASGPAGTKPVGATGACVLEPNPRTTMSVFFKLPDAFTSLAWHVPACSACPSPLGLRINSLTMGIRWFTTCSAQVEVSIVGATGPSGCRVPDPSNVLCGPLTHTISGTGVTALHTLPLPSGCCLTGELFALVRFIGFDACADANLFTPGLSLATSPCVNCDAYLTTLASVPSLTDWCPIAGTFGSIWMQLDADCCTVTGVGPRSWGSLKMLYR